MKWWAGCQRYSEPREIQAHTLGEARKHLSTSVPWPLHYFCETFCKDIRASPIKLSFRSTWYLEDPISKADLTLIKGEYLTWKTGVVGLSSTFLAAVTHLTLHQPSVHNWRVRLLPSYIEANRNTTSPLPRAEGQKQRAGGIQPSRSKIQKVNSHFQRELRLPRSSEEVHLAVEQKKQ